MNQLAHILPQTGAYIQEDDTAALRGLFQQIHQAGIKIPRPVGEIQFQKAELAQAWVRMNLPGAVALEIRTRLDTLIFSMCPRCRKSYIYASAYHTEDMLVYLLRRDMAVLDEQVTKVVGHNHAFFEPQRDVVCRSSRRCSVVLTTVLYLLGRLHARRLLACGRGVKSLGIGDKDLK